MIRRTLILYWLTLQVAGAAEATNVSVTNLLDVLHNAISAVDNAGTVKGLVFVGKTNKVHLLAPGDVVQLQVYQEEDLNLMRAPIAKDGTISHPLLGLIPVAGKTLDEARRIIFNMLQQDYLVDPRVSLTIVDFAKGKFTILGEVAHPSTYEFSSNEPLTVVQALALAGGSTRPGSLPKIKVQRVVDGAKNEVRLDAEKKEDKVFLIQDGDVIEVGEKVF